MGRFFLVFGFFGVVEVDIFFMMVVIENVVVLDDSWIVLVEDVIFLVRFLVGEFFLEFIFRFLCDIFSMKFF